MDHFYTLSVKDQLTAPSFGSHPGQDYKFGLVASEIGRLENTLCRLVDRITELEATNEQLIKRVTELEEVTNPVPLLKKYGMSREKKGKKNP